MQVKDIETKKDWDDFVLTLQPNTFLQSWQWKQVQELDGEHVSMLGFYDHNKLVSACLVILVHAKRGNYYLVPHGPIVKDEKEYKSVIQDLVIYVKAKSYKLKARPVALRIAPLIETPDTDRSIFYQLGFRNAPMHVHAELTWMLDIAKPEEELLQGMRKTTRHAVSKAEKEGVQVEIIPDVSALERFWPLYDQTRSRHEFIPFSKQFMQSQAEIFGASHAMFFAIAIHEGKDIAGAMCMQFGNTVFYYHGASVKTSVPAAQLLQWRAIQEAKKRGAVRYNFWGIAPERSDAPRSLWRSGARHHPFEGITVFKKGFGGYAINYMHAQDLPLSWRYWPMWAVEMFRKKKRGF